MRKANDTNKALVILTLLFTLIAAISFAAFKQTDDMCAQSGKCQQTAPAKKGAEMLWDGFSRRFISLVSF